MTDEELIAALERYTNPGPGGYRYHPAFALLAAQRIRELREALDYYGGEHERPSEGPWGVFSNDFGDIARATLAKGSSDV